MYNALTVAVFTIDFYQITSKEKKIILFYTDNKMRWTTKLLIVQYFIGMGVWARKRQVRGGGGGGAGWGDGVQAMYPYYSTKLQIHNWTNICTYLLTAHYASWHVGQQRRSSNLVDSGLFSGHLPMSGS